MKTNERKRSLTPKRKDITDNSKTKERERYSPLEKKRRDSNSPVPSSSNTRNQKRSEKSPRKRSLSRSKSKSPPAKKISRHSPEISPKSKSKPNNSNHNDKSRRYSDRSDSRSLSYSPARRNPERYREVAEKHKKEQEKNKKPQPVVKLHPTSSDRESSDNEAQSVKSNDKVEEFLPIDKIEETEKELNMLKALKSGLAAKAKQTLEKKKIISEANNTYLLKTDAGPNKSPVLEHDRVREMNIAAQARSQDDDLTEAFPHKGKDDFKKKITIKPFKINEQHLSPKKDDAAQKMTANNKDKIDDKSNQDSNLDDAKIEKKPGTERKSRSISRSSRSR